MMQNRLADSMREFEQVLQREVNLLTTMFQQRVWSNRGPGLGRYAENYSLWSRTTSYPNLLRRLVLVSERSTGEWEFRELVAGDGQFREAAIDARLTGLRERFDRLGSRWTPRLRLWLCLPRLGMLIRSEFESGRGLQAQQTGYMILDVDWAYIHDAVFPELEARIFGGPDDKRQYEIAVLASAGPRFLYRSEPSIDRDWLASVDNRVPIQLGVGAFPGATGAQFRDSTPVRTGTDSNEQSLQPLVILDNRRLVQGLGRPRVLVAGVRPPFGVELAGAHVSGYLSAELLRLRLRNLSAGLGVLLVLACAAAAVVATARKAKGLAEMQVRFIAGVTHELRTPLAVIRSAGENIADGVLTSDSKVRTYGELIRDQGRRLSDLVEQTLELAALDAGRRPLETGPLDVREVVADVLQRTQPIIAQSGFTVEQDSDDDLPPVRADKRAVQQILANLVSNAVKYGKPGCWIRIETCLDDSRRVPRVRVRVHDRGTGIPKDEAGHVFDPYYRGAAASAAKVQGSGLGLKLARDLARRMRGRLYFESEVGKGSVFTLDLPVDRSDRG